MFNRLRAAWRDPGMWSTVIASVIAAAILGAVGVIWTTHSVIVSGVSATIDRAATAFRVGWGWLAGSASMPHWLLFLMLLCIVLLVRAARRHGNRLIIVETQLLDHLYPGPKLEPDPETIVDGYTPTPGQLALLERAARVRGMWEMVPFKDARRILERIDRTATWDDTVCALKELKRAGAVAFANDRFGNGVNGTLGYRITQAGREYMRKRREEERASKRI